MRARCVLVVDPDPGAADVVRTALPRADIARVDTVYEALAQFEHRHVDLLIAERLLPGASADDLLHRLERAGHAVPVVLCSHRRTPMTHQHPFVVAAFTKPVDPEALRRVVTAPTTVTAA
jgi:DNA-binding response OmpR family regulator